MNSTPVTTQKRTRRPTPTERTSGKRPRLSAQLSIEPGLGAADPGSSFRTKEEYILNHGTFKKQRPLQSKPRIAEYGDTWGSGQSLKFKHGSYSTQKAQLPRIPTQQTPGGGERQIRSDTCEIRQNLGQRADSSSSVADDNKSNDSVQYVPTLTMYEGVEFPFRESDDASDTEHEVLPEVRLKHVPFSPEHISASDVESFSGSTTEDRAPEDKERAIFDSNRFVQEIVGQEPPSSPALKRRRSGSDLYLAEMDHASDPVAPESHVESAASKATHEGHVTFQCTSCPTSFTCIDAFRSHLHKVHEIEPDFIFSTCGKVFKKEPPTEKRFVCGGTLNNGDIWGCGRTFRNSKMLLLHFRMESGRECMKPLRYEELGAEAEKWHPKKLALYVPKAVFLKYPDLIDGQVGLRTQIRNEGSEGNSSSTPAHAPSKYEPREAADEDAVLHSSRNVVNPESANTIGFQNKENYSMISNQKLIPESSSMPGFVHHSYSRSVGSSSQPTRIRDDFRPNPPTGASMSTKCRAEKHKSLVTAPMDDGVKLTKPTGPTDMYRPDIQSRGEEPDNSASTSQVNPPSEPELFLHQAKEDSGYQTKDTSNTETSIALSKNFIQELIPFFGDELIKKTYARQWMNIAVSNHSTQEVEQQLSDLLGEYLMKLPEILSSDIKMDNIIANTEAASPARINAILKSIKHLIYRNRSRIARYFCTQSIPAPEKRLRSAVQPLSRNGKLDLVEKFSSHERRGKEKALQEQADMETAEEHVKGVDRRKVQRNLLLDTLVSSNAFRELGLQLRRKLYLDEGFQKRIIDRKVQHILPSAHPLRETVARIELDLDILGFMQHQYGEVVPVSSVVVLTGPAHCAYATTCGDYVQTTWPVVGPKFLKALDAVLSQKKAVLTTIECTLIRVKCEIGVNASNRLYTIVRGSDMRGVSSIVQMLSWMGAALNFSPNEASSKYMIPTLHEQHDSSNRDILLEIKFECAPIDPSENACWLTLFNGATVALGFPIPTTRADEVGLEIPVELLAQIAGVRHAVEFDGGVVLKGFSHMLVPIKKIGNIVQWHAITSTDEEERLTYNDGIARCGSRLMLDDFNFDDLQTTRAIVGWCSIAISRLGSNLADYDNLDYTKAKVAGSVLRCAGGQLGFQQFGTGAVDFRLGTKEGNVHIPRLGRYRKIICAADKTPILLYDTDKRRAWLVFASDVLLHMIQHRNHLEPFEIGGKRVTLATTVRSGSSAKQILLEKENLEISDDKTFTFKDVVLDLWSQLERLVDQNVVQGQGEAGVPVKATLREYLRGYEFKAIVEDRSPFVLKEIELRKTHGGWPMLVRDANVLVLIADGFGEVLLPAKEAKTRLCERWERVPHDLDYLATTSKVLNDLYNVAGCRVSREYLTATHLRWHRGTSVVFEDCENTKSCHCDRLQQIVSKTSVGTIVPPETIADEGAVIFGHRGLLRQDFFRKILKKSGQPSGIYCQPNIPLTPIDGTYNTNENSNIDQYVLTGSDSTSDSNHSSLSTCTTMSTNDPLSCTDDLIVDIQPTSCPQKRLRCSEEQRRLSDEHKKSYRHFEANQTLPWGDKRQRIHVTDTTRQGVS